MATPQKKNLWLLIFGLTMLIDRLLYPVETLGPGKRIAIWVVGCGHYCKGCSNPELWTENGQEPITPEALFVAIQQIATNNRVDGITITGGEPFDQSEDLLKLVCLLQTLTADILVFSGYQHSQLLKWPVAVAVLDRIAVLVDGPYQEKLNVGLLLRGSSNQHILLFDLGLQERYEDYIKSAKKCIQNFYFDDCTVSVGIHGVGFEKDLDNFLKTMNIRRVSDERSEMAPRT